MPFVKQHNSQELLNTGGAGARHHRDVVHDEEHRAVHGGAMTDAEQGFHVKNMGKRLPPKSDIVLVFPYKVHAKLKYGEAEAEETNRGLQPPTASQLHKMETWASKRSSCIHALSDAGLVLMLYYSRDRDEIFARVALDEMHMRQVAEMRRYQLELKPQYLSAYAEYRNDYAGRRDLKYSDRCVVSHLYKHHVDTVEGEYPQPGAIFRTVDRIRLLDHVVRSNDHNCAGIDIGQMMHDGDLKQFFPLHEHRKLKSLDDDWFKAFAWGQEIEKVRDYFGERIALYFLFMSHFNKWLVIPSAVGLLLIFIDLIFGTPDNPTAVFLCLAMSFWATTFVHFWRRTAATHALKWGTLNTGKQLEATRPEFTGGSRINPVTGRVDRYYPWSERIWKVAFSATVLIASGFILVFVILFTMWLRHKVHARMTFQIITALIVEVFNNLFTYIAKWLTDRENHRAYSEYQTHLLAKTVIFKFINCYFPLYYIAFFKQNNRLFDEGHMSCAGSDCLSDLSSQLGVFMFIRLTAQNFAELGLPYLVMWWRNMTEKRAFQTSFFGSALTVMPDMSSPERQSKKEEYDVFADMDEVLMLYGYTTLFVVACPWVPFVALISNLLECFLDQKKLVLLYRRPFPSPAANNEPWDTAFDVFGIIAMMTNVAVIVFTSQAYKDWSHSHKIVLFLVLEHLMIAGRVIIGIVLPALPHEVRVLRMQQQVMVHKHLNLGGGAEDDHEARTNAMIFAQGPPIPIYDADDEDDE